MDRGLGLPQVLLLQAEEATHLQQGLVGPEMELILGMGTAQGMELAQEMERGMELVRRKELVQGMERVQGMEHHLRHHLLQWEQELLHRFQKHWFQEVVMVREVVQQTVLQKPQD